MTTRDVSRAIAEFSESAAGLDVVLATTGLPLSEVRTNKEDHFSGALSQYAVEEEDVSGLTGNQIVIREILLLADQNLDWRLYFYSTDDFANADLDVDDLLDYLDFASGDAVRRGNTWKYIWRKTGLAIYYEDMDGSKELHLALENLNATAKNAGATGEVVLRIRYEPLLTTVTSA